MAHNGVWVKVMEENRMRDREGGLEAKRIATENCH